MVDIGAYGVTIGGGGSGPLGVASTGTIQRVNASYATIGGGFQNKIQTNADNSIIGGGINNTIQHNSDNSTISGGVYNTIKTNTHNSTIGGGYTNTIQASAGNATIGGGVNNTIQAFSYYGTIPGGANNSVAADYGFAAGYRAKANHQGAFVWADSQNADFTSTGDDQFLIRASGGLGVGVTNPAYLADFGGRIRIRNDPSSAPLTAGVWLADDAFVGLANSNGAVVGLYGNHGAGWQLTMNTTNGYVGVGLSGGSADNYFQVRQARCDGFIWINQSDRNLKQDFAAVDTVGVLEKIVAMPIQIWSYKGQLNQKHLGPMAQDFHAAFGLGNDDRAISTVDEGGVALAAIQGLNEKVESGKLKVENQLTELQRENTELKARLEKLERVLNTQPKANQ